MSKLTRLSGRKKKDEGYKDPSLKGMVAFDRLEITEDEYDRTLVSIQGLNIYDDRAYRQRRDEAIRDVLRAQRAKL